jgi:hypothetical protein
MSNCKAKDREVEECKRKYEVSNTAAMIVILMSLGVREEEGGT